VDFTKPNSVKILRGLKAAIKHLVLDFEEPEKNHSDKKKS